MNDQHILKAFDRDLEAIQAQILKMGGLVEEAILQGGEALASRDVELADRVRKGDKAIDALEEHLNEEVARTIALRAPVSRDLRILLSVLRLAASLERVGDYAKNLLDLATDGARLGDLPEAADWRRVAADVARMIDDTGAAFRARDGSRCRALRMSGDALLHRCDEEVSALIRRDDPGAQAVARALAWRYFKRVVAHLMNVLSAVIMPLDRLDYFDEDPEDRADLRDASAGA